MCLYILTLQVVPVPVSGPSIRPREVCVARVEMRQIGAKNVLCGCSL